MRKLVYIELLCVIFIVLSTNVNAQGDDGFYFCAQEIESLVWHPDSSYFAVQGLSDIPMLSPELLTVNYFNLEMRSGVTSDSPVSCSGRGID